MAPASSRPGYDVVGLDTGYFDECTLVPDTRQIRSIHKDIRDLEAGRPRGLRRRGSPGGAQQRSDRQPERRLDRGDQLPGRRCGWPSWRRRPASSRFLFSSSCIMYGMSEAAVVERGVAARPEDRVRALEGQGRAGASRQLAATGFLADVPAQRHGLRPVAAHALRHGVQRPDRRRGGDREGDGVQRRQAVAPGGARRGRRARVSRRARGAASRRFTTRRSTSARTTEPPGIASSPRSSCATVPGCDARSAGPGRAPTSAPTRPTSASSPGRFPTSIQVDARRRRRGAV